MKTIKTKLTLTGTNLYIKALLVGVFAGGLSVLILLCAVSLLLLVSGNLPLEFLVWFGVAIGLISSYICGYTTSRITKTNGMILGSLSGFIMYITLFIAGLICGDSPTMITLIKLCLYTLCGAIGGIKGVNKKEKLHIK